MKTGKNKVEEETIYLAAFPDQLPPSSPVLVVRLTSKLVEVHLSATVPSRRTAFLRSNFLAWIVGGWVRETISTAHCNLVFVWVDSLNTLILCSSSFWETAFGWSRDGGGWRIGIFCSTESCLTEGKSWQWKKLTISRNTSQCGD